MKPQTGERAFDSYEIEYILGATRLQEPAQMLEHLVDDTIQYTPDVEEIVGESTLLSKAKPAEVLEGQLKTASWLEELGAVPDADIVGSAQETTSRAAFTALATTTDPAEQKANLAKLQSPEAVRHLVGMLTAYDWKFVERAQELRGYAVAQLVEETKHPDARIRLKALELLGKVTEVALFTERVEVKKTELSDDELNAKIKEKLSKYAKIIDVDNVTDIEVMEEDIGISKTIGGNA